MHPFLTALCIAAMVLVSGCAEEPATSSTEAPGLTIERMVAISDGDHAASTYVDGRLAPLDAGFRDVLTTVSVIDGQVSTAQVDVSNSVTAAPEALALTPGGDAAFVAERLASRRPGDGEASDLAPGTSLTAVDVSDLAAPQVITRATVAARPEAVSVSPDGSRVAVVANPPGGAVVQILDWSGAAFGAPMQTDLRLGGGVATNVHWRPDGEVLAVNIDSHDQVAFFTVEHTGALRPWGAAVPTGVDPFVGRFTPDGRFYLTANWGRDLSTTVADERLPEQRSTLSVIELDDSAAAHRVVAEAESDVSSEGLAISPDGTLVATVNMRGTTFPAGSPKFDEHASVSLMRLADDGGLTKVGDYPLTAVLPEGGTFDTTGQYFIATSYQGREGDDGGSGLQIYRVDSDAGLVPVDRISLPQGTHHVAVA